MRDGGWYWLLIHHWSLVFSTCALPSLFLFLFLTQQSPGIPLVTFRYPSIQVSRYPGIHVSRCPLSSYLVVKMLTKTGTIVKKQGPGMLRARGWCHWWHPGGGVEGGNGCTHLSGNSYTISSVQVVEPKSSRWSAYVVGAFWNCFVCLGCWETWGRKAGILEPQLLPSRALVHPRGDLRLRHKQPGALSQWPTGKIWRPADKFLI